MLFVSNLKPVRWMATAVALCATTAAGCGDESEAVPAYEEVAKILGTDGMGQSSCSLPGCHGGAAPLLTLDANTDLTALKGVPSCEAPALPLIDPGNPEGSWLYIKLSAEVSDTASGALVPQPEWGQPGTGCPNAAGFGTRMPQVPASGFMLPDEDLTVVYEWIKGGAPGPM